MRKVGLKVLKNKLSEYVRLAAGGETVLVTDRDCVVAQLIPPRRDPTEMTDEEFLAAAAREGRLSRATPRRGREPRRKPVAPLAAILADLAEDRADR